jgi:hypothetical protein
MKSDIKNWLLIGVKENWEKALSQPVPIWGLKHRYQKEFQNLDTGDIVWFYITSPISGVIGVGTIKDKYIDNINLVWSEEFFKKEVIWPLRFRIQVLKTIHPEFWETQNIKVKDFNLIWRIGFQLLSKEQSIELLQRSKEILEISNQLDLYKGASISKPLVTSDSTIVYPTPIKSKTEISNHREIQNSIAEIGKLQFYHTQIEYPIELPGEDKHLDVVWKREISGVPTFAFEVELSGMVEKAVVRLKFAFNKWNSRPRIVIPEQSLKKVQNIIASEDREFSHQLKIYEPNQLLELLNRKRDLKSLEQNLGIY